MKQDLNGIIIDSTGDCLKIFLLTGNVIYEHLLEQKRHVHTILSAIEELLLKFKIEIKEIKHIGVVTGPGSFTGSRIGVATANAIAKSINGNIVGFNVLEIMLYGENSGLAYVDAGNDNIYSLQKDELGEENYLFTKKGTIDSFIKKNFKIISKYSKDKIINLFKEKVAKSDFISKASPFYMRESSAERLAIKKDIFPPNNRANKAPFSHINNSLSKDGFSLAIAKIENADKILHLEREVFQEPWNKRQILEELLVESSINLIITDAKANIVGYILSRVISDELEIMRIAIQPTYQRRGLGAKLMLAITERARDLGVKNIFLEVNSSNKGAINFYEKEMFVKLGIRKNYYSQGSDALNYKKEIG